MIDHNTDIILAHDDQARSLILALLDSYRLKESQDPIERFKARENFRRLYSKMRELLTESLLPNDKHQAGFTLPYPSVGNHNVTIRAS